MKLKEFTITGLKGFSMGAGIFPGVSAGTVALMTGIFRPLIASLSAILSLENWKLLFKKDFKGFWKAINGEFLLPCVIGMALGFLVLARLVGWALSYWPIPTWAFFFGLILASAFFMLKAVKGWKVPDALLLAAGIGLGLAVCTLTPSQTPDNMFFIFLCGAIAICTMILPGVSGSFILVVMGKYDYMMSAVSNLDWGVLAVFALGCLAGILAFAKLLHWLLARWERQTMLVLTGFVLGSLVKVWPWANVPAGADPRVGSAVLWCLLGVALIVAIELLAKKSPK